MMNFCVVLKDDQYNQEILGLGWDFDYVMNISESDFPVRWREDQSWYLLMRLYRYVLMYDQSYIWTFSVKKVISQPWLVQKPSSLTQIHFLLTFLFVCIYWCLLMFHAKCNLWPFLPAYPAIDLTNPYFRHKQKGTTSNLAKAKKNK